MRLSRPFFSHRLAPSFIRTVMQAGEAGFLFALFHALSNLAGRFVFGAHVDMPAVLKAGAFMVACAFAGGIVYAGLVALAVRRGAVAGAGRKVVLVLLSGELTGALGSLLYWRRAPGPDEFSHGTFTLLAMAAGALMALFLGAIVAWQNRWERATRALEMSTSTASASEPPRRR